LDSTLLIKKRYDITNFPVFSEFIFLLDSYRVQQYTELKWADKVIEEGKMGFYFKRDWEEIRKTLTKMARVPAELHYLLNWAKYQNMFKFIGNIISTVMLLIFALSVFFAFARDRSLFTAFANLIVILLPVVVIGLFVSFAGPPIISRKIYQRLSEYRAKNKEQFEKWEAQIKFIVQNLILSASQQANEGKLKQELNENNQDLVDSVDQTYKSFWKRLTPFRNKEMREGKNSEFVFDLFKTDYQNIQVTQKPSLLRKHYKVRLI
jgi:predicted PurR-regulated permease PerM